MINKIDRDNNKQSSVLRISGSDKLKTKNKVGIKVPGILS